MSFTGLIGFEESGFREDWGDWVGGAGGHMEDCLSVVMSRE